MEIILDFDDAITSDNLQQLALKLSQLPCFDQHKVIGISVIEAGLSQACFYVKYDNKAYFAKYLSANSNEPLANQLAATYGIAPQLMYVGQHWLITEFIVGEGLDKSPQTENEKLAITIALLARCHSIPHDNFSKQNCHHSKYLSLTSSTMALNKKQVLGQVTSKTIAAETSLLEISILDIASTISQLLQHIALSPIQVQTLKKLAKVLQQNLVNQQRELPNPQGVFCHGDANFSNVISVNNTTVKSVSHDYQLIDFECACIAPIEYDLAMLMAVNELDSSKVSMINLRYIKARNNISKHEVEQVNRPEKSTVIVDNLLGVTMVNANPSNDMVTCYYYLCLTINGLWYFSQYQHRKVVKYQTLAIKQLDLLAIRYPQINILLDEMR